MPLYHCTHRELKIDDLIEPGNWGAKIFEQSVSHPCWDRETVLETVRAEHFANKPSRLRSTFSCDNIETIRCYRSVQCKGGFIYEVEIVDKELSYHKGDFNYISSD